jgi:hypothetical protein
MKKYGGTLVDYYRRNRLSETPIGNSSDDTTDVWWERIHKIAQVGLDIKHRRSNRTGYKAGLKKVCLAPKFIAILMLIYLKRLAL